MARVRTGRSLLGLIIIAALLSSIIVITQRVVDLISQHQAQLSQTHGICQCIDPRMQAFGGDPSSRHGILGRTRADQQILRPAGDEACCQCVAKATASCSVSCNGSPSLAKAAGQDQAVITLGSGQPAGEETPDPKSSIKLFVAVASGAGNRKKRDAIRATWGTDKRLYRVMFISRKPKDEGQFDALRLEAVQQRDLVIEPHVYEDYHGTAHNTLLGCMVASMDPNWTHFMKADDDIYLRVGLLLDRISKLPPAQPTYLGTISFQYEPIRDFKGIHGLYAVSEKDWPAKHYPPFAHGPGYILTPDIVREIAAGAPLKPFNHTFPAVEDVAMGIYVDYIQKERKMEVNIVDERGFSCNPGCRNNDLIDHYIKPAAVRCMFEKGGDCCTEEEAAKYQDQVGS